MKRLLFARNSATLLLITLFVLNLFSCKQRQAEIVPSVEFAQYVNAYTGGVISQASPIRIELSQDQPLVDLNSEIKGNVFSFSPSLKGKAYWVSNNTIEFMPDEGALKSGQLYTASFKLGELVDVDKELQKFDFSFRVMQRDFNVVMQPIEVKTNDAETVTIRGELRFSDVVKPADVEKMFKVTDETKSNKHSVTVEQGSDGKIFRFYVPNVKKEDKTRNITLDFAGNTVGVDNTHSSKVAIPAKGIFKVVADRRISEPANGIRVFFTEALNPSQNLEGLVSIPQMSNYTLDIKDNHVDVYFEPTSMTYYNIDISEGIVSSSGKILDDSYSSSYSQDAPKPQVSMSDDGTIMPDSKSLIIPFQAVSLYAVDVSVIRIFESNVLMFLQTNSFGNDNELRRSGRLVYKTTLQLDSDPTKDITNWEDYSIDLSGVIKQEPGALYRIVLSFKQEYSAYPCGAETTKRFSTSSNMTNILSGDLTDEDVATWDMPQTYYDTYYEGIDWEEFDWDETDNPCHSSYYMYYDKKVSRTVMASNIGLIVKQNNANKIWATVTNILDTNPIANAEVTAYNFQLQPIGTGKTNAQGMVEIQAKGKVFAVIASHNKHKTYLKVTDGIEKSTSRFDVGGKVVQKGLKGYIYGERGVWRPGDTLHVTFLLEDKEKRVPASHPVSFEIYNPRGQFYTKLISTKGINGFHTFTVPTTQDVPTGLWNAYVKVGGTSFHKGFRIEAVKPNRLKINLQVPNDRIDASDGWISLGLNSAWLTGATASHLKTKVEMSLSRVNTQFSSFSQYNFNNPATNFTTSKMELYDGTLDGSGNASFRFDVPDADDAPGMLQASITSRVFEPGGDASINTTSVPFSPFGSYVGVNLNQPQNRYIETDTDHTIDIVTVDPTGKLVNRSDLEYKIYRVGWSWWWDRRTESFASYINSSSYTPEATGRITTKDGRAQIKFRVDYPRWGRYLVYVKDRDSGHASGGLIYIDWPDWRGRSNKSDPSNISMLTFSLDKDNYEVGETATAFIPAAAEGRALVAIENGSSVLKQEWITVNSEGDTKYQFKITEEMTPNVYLHVVMLQPHAQTLNDLPIRMFGVMPVFVSNKDSKLEPEIKMPDVLRPETEFSVTVSEKQGKPMTYTVAVVDDGLLDLTNFKTPNAWNEFYAREALGIRMWDMFDDVIGAYSGSYGSMFSIGGDEDMGAADEKANRFRPVVKFLGPFTLEKGKTATHKITLPMYVGSVRTMIVAGQNGAYGSAEKTTPVRTPLMLLSTLPRVLSTNEEILLPVNVFAMEDDIKNVTVTVETSDNLQLVDGKTKSITFSKTGDQLVLFKVKTGELTRKEEVKVTVSGNGQSSYETIEIDVRNPNPALTSYTSHYLEAGKDVDMSYALGGNINDSWVKLEVSRIPSIDISRRMDYLYNYPHMCSEQITSATLPQLFIGMFKELDANEQASIKTNVQAAIQNLYSRQLANGGILYWPNQTTENEWITSYAGSLLVMAQEKGYDVNQNVLNKWKSYQKRAAQEWTTTTRENSWYGWQGELQQAYRLYTLALAGAPEMGAMNRMKEMPNVSLQARWKLAAAYALAGKTDAANELIMNQATDVAAYSSSNYVYGSDLRDEAMILETLVLVGKQREAFLQAQKISTKMSKQNYFSTQSTAFALMAMGKLADAVSGSLDFTWTLNGKDASNIKSSKAMYQANLPTNPRTGSVKITNKGDGAIYVDLITRTQLVVDTLPETANNLKLEVTYEDMRGNPINIRTLKQGADFVANVKVTNLNSYTDYNDVALTHIIPSGWEIYNERMINPDEADSNSDEDSNLTKYAYDYRDIRDDRVLTYFNINRAKVKEFKIRLQATYAGTFTLPAIQCEAMYDVEAQARTKAGTATVER